MTEFYLGQIIQFAGNFAMKGTALCNGQLLSIQQNTALFSILGTTYGGNGTSNFLLPNLQGRSMVHQGTVSGVSYTLGQSGGLESTTLNANTMPAHTHSVAGTLSASGLQPKATQEAATAGAVLGHADDISTQTAKAKPAIYCPSGTAAPIGIGGINVVTAAVGSSQPVSILNPYLTISCVIWLVGIFPSRN